MPRSSFVPNLVNRGVRMVASSYHLPDDLAGRARAHVRKRVEYAVETAVHAYHIARGNYLGPTTARAAIGIRGAQYQNETGTVDAHAAHVLPGQITLNDLALSDLVLAHAQADTRGDYLLGATRLNFLSSATHILPVNFNKVDSRFERAGGKRAYENLVRTTWNAGVRPQTQPETASQTFEAAHAQFVRESTLAFQTAVRRLEEKIQTKPDDTALQAQCEITRIEMAATASYRPEALHQTRLSMIAGTYDPA